MGAGDGHEKGFPRDVMALERRRQSWALTASTRRPVLPAAPSPAAVLLMPISYSHRFPLSSLFYKQGVWAEGVLRVHADGGGERPAAACHRADEAAAPAPQHEVPRQPHPLERRGRCRRVDDGGLGGFRGWAGGWAEARRVGDAPGYCFIRSPSRGRGWLARALLATQPERHISARSKPPLPPPSASIQAEFKSPSREAVEIFKSILEERRVPVSVRITRGLEAAAACGQLRNMYQKTPLQEFEVPA